MTDYNKQASDFLLKANATIDFKFMGKKMNTEWKDTQKRNTYLITIKKNNREMAFTFWDSIIDTQNNKKPSAYDVLACLTKYDPGTFEDFCGEFGYDEDSRSAERIYNAVCKEYSDIERLFTDEELEELREIN